MTEGQSGQLRVIQRLSSSVFCLLHSTIPLLHSTVAEKADYFLPSLLLCWLWTCLTTPLASEGQADAWLDIVIMSLCLKPILKPQSRILALQCRKKVPRVFAVSASIPSYAAKQMSSGTPLTFWKDTGIWMWHFISKGMCWMLPSHDFWMAILNFSWDLSGWVISSHKSHRKALYYL